METAVVFFVAAAWSATAEGSVMDDLNVKTDQIQQKTHVIDSLDLLVYLILLTVAIVTTWVFKKKRSKYFHESGLSVILGLMVGAILRFAGSDTRISALDVIPRDERNDTRLFEPPDLLRINVSKHVFAYAMLGPEGPVSQVDVNDIQEKATFDPEIFFYVILPPIIFHAGYSMRKKHFFNNIGSILTYALLGTLLSTVVIAGIMWLVVQVTSTRMWFLDTLYFGSIVSATDPVTILALFHDLNVEPMLTGLVLGESLLNDAVAIVLCGAIEDYSRFSLTGNADTFNAEAFFRTIGKFFGIFFGSIGLGALLGSITALLTKFTRVRDFPLLETSLFFLLSYSSYLLAETCQMSGIVAILFCGISQAHYTFHNLSLESKIRTRQLFELLNFLLENFIFSYIGVSMFTFSRHKFHFLFIGGALVALAVSRAVNIYPLSLLLNLGRSKKIPLRYQHILWFSGLRGAMAFALAMKNTVSEPRQIFLTTTSLISILTVIVCGGLTTPLLNFLQIPVGVSSEEGEGGGGGAATDGSIDDFSIIETTPTSVHTQTPKSYLAKVWKSADRKILKPLLTNCQPTLQETLPWAGRVARWLTTEDQMAGVYANREDPEGELVCYSRGPTDTTPASRTVPVEVENSLSCGD